MRAYLEDIAKTALLTREQERALGLQAAARCRCNPKTMCPACRARDHLVRANLRLVVAVANRYTGRGLAIEDLAGEGNLGLIRAAELYDPAAFPGVKFATYATWWIRQAIQKSLDDYRSTVRVPANAYRDIPHMIKARADLRGELGRPPTVDELAARMGTTPAKVRIAEAGERAANSISADQPAFNDNHQQVKDLLPAREPEEIADSHRAELLRRSLRHLPAKERAILTRRFGLDGKDPQTLEEISVDYGVSKERIRQIEKRSLRKLRALLEDVI